MKAKLTELQTDLLKNKIINLDTDINEKTFEYIRSCFEILSVEGFPDITIWFSSKGGIAEFGLFIFDLFKVYPGVKTGLVIGYAHSTASFILQVCDKRYGLENSQMRIHYMEQNEISTQTILDQKKLKKFIKDVVHDKKKLISIYKNKKITKRKLKEVLCKDEYLSMKKALSFGLIDKIIDRLP